MKKGENLSFEESMEGLEDIVNELEKGELSLDDMMKKFKKGMELSKHCSTLLEEAEKSITILLKDADGEMKEEEFKV
jgi:exodeoxyribonuclease VII small subunit